MTISDPDLPGQRDPGVLARPEFRQGLAEITRRGLVFDAAVVQSQLGELVDLSRAAPDATIVLNNTGTPLGIGRYADRRTEAFAEWRAGMAEVAKCPNIFVKIGGLNMAFTGLAVADARAKLF